MEALILIAVIVCIILIVVNFSSLNKRLDSKDYEIKEIKSLLRKLTEEKKPQSIREEDVKKPVTETERYKEHIAENKSEEVSSKKPVPEPVTPVLPKAEEVKVPETKVPQPSYIASKVKPEKPFATTEKKKAQFEIDFEKFIGENIISKIGIVILVLGVGYFVKYAIDQDWINEYGRVAIGILTGGALIGVAHWLRKDYKTFSSILTGGGFAVLYTTITIGYHQYHILSQAGALGVMVIITLFSVVLSLIYDKKELAIFSQLGGYASPFLVSTGDGNFISLFIYVLILNAGLIVLAYYKRWNILTIIAYIFTVILFGTWVFSGFRNHGIQIHTIAFVFATLFYLVFFVVNIINNLKERQKLNGIEIGIILSNNLFFLLAGLFILNKSALSGAKGLFPVIIGVFNFIWLVYLYKRKNIDKVLIYLLIGLVMSFISIAIPIQLKGHSITLFWSAEIVILLWLAQKSGITLLKSGHFIILVLSVISILMDWQNMSYTYTKLPIVINKYFITGIVLCAALYFSYLLLKNEKLPNFVEGITVKLYRTFILFGFAIALYVVLFLELNFQMNQYYSNSTFRYSIYALYNIAFIGTLLLFDFFKNNRKIITELYAGVIALLIAFAVVTYFQNISLRDFYLLNMNVSLGNFLFHYISYAFVIGIIVLLAVNKSLKERIALWVVTALLIFMISAETDNVVLISMGSLKGASLMNIEPILHKIHKVGYPVLWTIMAFILMVWGMKKKIQDLRVISLSLLGLIIVKLIAIDVWQMTQGGRIIAFIFLGIVLLVVSFMYQKLKQILVDDNVNESSEEKKDML
jgi:uncharacterized membrane protein